MPLVTTTEMFKKAYEGGYAIGAFNVNNMEIIQGIVEAAQQEKAPVIPVSYTHLYPYRKTLPAASGCSQVRKPLMWFAE